MNEFDENRDGRIEMAEVGDTFKFPLPDDKSIFASNKLTATHLLLKDKNAPLWHSVGAKSRSDSICLS